MNLIEFTDQYGRRVMVNADKVLALYENGKTSQPSDRTFIELAPDGVQDATGPIVMGTLEEVKEKLQPATKSKSTGESL